MPQGLVAGPAGAARRRAGRGHLGGQFRGVAQRAAQGFCQREMRETVGSYVLGTRSRRGRQCQIEDAGRLFEVA